MHRKTFEGGIGMSDWKKDLDLLLAKVVEDELSATEMVRLDEILFANPDAREFYRQYINVHSSLQEHLALPDFSAMNQAVETVTKPEGKTIARPNFTPIWQWGLGAAAVFVFLFVVLSDAPTTAMASTIQATAGNVKVIQPDGTELFNPDPGTSVPAGAIIETVSADSLVELGFDDRSTVTLSEPAACRIIRYDKHQRNIKLIHGRLWADITPQPERSPLIVHTSSSRLEVLGTVFNVEARSSSSRLHVSRGTVRLTRLADNRSTEVHENQEIMASLNSKEEFTTLTPPKAVNHWQGNLTTSGGMANSVTLGHVKQMGEQTVVAGERILIPKNGKFVNRTINKSDYDTIAVISFSVQQFGAPPVALESGSIIHLQGLTMYPEDLYFYLSTQDKTGAFSGKYYVPVNKAWFKGYEKKAAVKGKEGWQLNIPVKKFLWVSKRGRKKLDTENSTKTAGLPEKKVSDRQNFPTGLYLSDIGVVSKKGKLGILLTKAAVVPKGQLR